MLKDYEIYNEKGGKNMVAEKNDKAKVAKFVVVNELPTVQTREAQDENEQPVELITMPEAITEILTLVREIKKGL
jgi:hypothetical protein